MNKSQSIRRWGASVAFAGMALGVATAQTETGTKTPTAADSKKLAAVMAKKVPTFEKAAAAAKVPRDPAAMTLTDLHGRELRVVLMEANGDMLRIKRETDDQEFEIQLAQLDALSLRRVEGWKDRNPDAMNFSLEFKAEKRMVESSDFETSGRELETSQWVYDVAITNLTRNELKDAFLEYRIIYDDQVNFVRTSASPGKGPKRQEGDGVALPMMGFNERAEFSTARLDLHKYEYTPSRGAKESERDKLVGIWIRVMKRGEVLAEFKSNETTMADLAWDDEDETEIVIRDTFKEQFMPREGDEETESQSQITKQ